MMFETSRNVDVTMDVLLIYRYLSNINVDIFHSYWSIFLQLKLILHFPIYFTPLLRTVVFPFFTKVPYLLEKSVLPILRSQLFIDPLRRLRKFGSAPVIFYQCCGSALVLFGLILIWIRILIHFQ
jgi:hypothetical protein